MTAPGVPGTDGLDSLATLAGLEAAWVERRSKRAFRPDPIPRATLERLFAAAQHAPSWCNTQPWRVAITEPPVTGELAVTLQAAAKSGLPHPEVPFPLEFPAPYKEHRIRCGAALYTAMGGGWQAEASVATTAP